MLHNDPSSPIVWLTHAKSDLLLSKFYDSKEILLNQLCYHAQQSVEKSIKAILIQSKVNFKFTHNIKNLIASLPQEIEKPNFFKDLPILTDYAVSTRYPGDYEEILLSEYKTAIFLAQQTFDWAEAILKK
ncbi:HEPN domain protein [Leptospira interrogans str. 2003000735]|uniref:HEPN domain-containing protein n=9 Tax=Leptospira interrogans TaxID=173 RepID=Q8F296_LEPIN|nr:HEPN domain-containing protein [Leptospira interrogans]AER03128.1 HEPN domain-containing protein [Leptospira interrogans serovar Lai str. IPAV]AJR15067.1 HEPN domain-containing protein [Leptospira interrogans serovar Linhai str. 56609]ALE40139.1 HEPN domain-containing protein [Leptospira interrogans serovar Hardjo str. Norma]EKN89445.1 HEPN domain protein [Leptospira interrogans str. 2002000624]EKO86047.1 HEPN domain protein [Leptospira interrogans serovar Grippotyphosa str. Andaman]EKO981